MKIRTLLLGRLQRSGSTSRVTLFDREPPDPAESLCVLAYAPSDAFYFIRSGSELEGWGKETSWKPAPPTFTGGTSEGLTNRLNEAFGTLVFAPELATGWFTHMTHPASKGTGNNVGFVFTVGVLVCHSVCPLTPAVYRPSVYLREERATALTPLTP